MIKVITKQGAVLAGLLLLAAVTPVRAGLLQTFDFETGDLSRLGSIELNGTTASVTVSTDVARRGKYSMKAFINKADKRAEGASQLRGTVGGINWYGWSIYVPDNQHGDGKFDIITQFHDWHSTLPAWANDGTAPTNITLGEDNMLRFSLKYQGPMDPATGDPTTIHQVFDLAHCTVGTWHDFIVKVKWTHLPDGFLKVWLNGDLLVDYTGPTYMDYGAGNGPYFKMGDYKGIYNWPGTGPRYFYMDEFRMGDATSSYAEVNPALVAPQVNDGFDYASGANLDGADGAPGWASAWSVVGGVGQTQVLGGSLTYPGLTTSGNRFRLYNSDGTMQTVTRTMAGTAGEIPGTYWVSFLAKKNDPSRGSYIKFGGLEFSVVAPNTEWQVKTPGTAYTTLSGADYGTVHLFLARIDAGDATDTVRVWVDPVLTAGEPAAGTELATVTDVPFAFNTVTIQYGPGGKTTRSGEWDEIRIGRDFASVLGAMDIETAADAYVRGGNHATDNYGADTTLLVQGNTKESNVCQVYLRFDLAAYTGTPSSGKLVLTPTVLGSDIANASLQVLLVSDDMWQERQLTWNSRPAGGALLATINGADLQVGVPVQVDVTAAAVQEKAGDGKLSLVIIPTGASSLRSATFGSYDSGAAGPVLRLQ
ncbi:MAG: heparin lyase I family protein [Opitutaceae bacterium]|jgi:hypothetical protein